MSTQHHPTYDRHALAQIIKAYDVRGVVDGGATAEATIDRDFIAAVGAAYGHLLSSEAETRLVVGYDMRPSSPELARAFAEGVADYGINVTILGLTSTDELYYASGAWMCAGAMFTASHNPAQYNGIKLCRAGAKPVGTDTGLAVMTDLLAEGIPAPAAGTQPGKIDEYDILSEYAAHLQSLVDLRSIRPLVVAVDAANGMAGLTVPEVFKGLPITVKPLYFELDGTFPNHEANPLDPKNLVDLQKFTVDSGADIGLAFDGDADRCFVVDEKGNPVSPSAICALVAQRYLKQHPGAPIIHNLITSKAVPEIIEENGGTPVRTRVGHSYIKAEMATSGAVFGGEHSAHYYFSEFFNADSGILAALHVLAALGHAPESMPLSSLMAEYTRYAASGEINSTVADQQAATEAVLEAFASRIESTDDLDGVTVELSDTPAWFNLRASNTEPLLRLNVEAPTATEVDELVTEILAIVRAENPADA